MGRQRTSRIRLGRPSLKERFRDWLMDDGIIADIESLHIDTSSLHTTPMNLSIYRAAGGTIVETRCYDRKSDENNYRLHIITDDKDLGAEIGKIITMETLRG